MKPSTRAEPEHPKGAHEGRVALVTGGSDGMGRAIALRLASEGADIVFQYLGAVDDERGLGSAASETEAAIGALGRQAVAIDIGLNDPSAPAAIVGAARDAFGRIDIVVSNVGIQHWRSLQDIDVAEAESEFRVNILIPLMLGQLCLPEMAERGWGRFVTVGSVTAQSGHTKLVSYAASKAAVANLAVSFAKLYAAQGVTVNNISPGLIETSRNSDRRRDPDNWRQLLDTHLMKRAGTVDEVAAAVSYLCSPEAGFVTGIDLPVSGGQQLCNADRSRR